MRENFARQSPGWAQKAATWLQRWDPKGGNTNTQAHHRQSKLFLTSGLFSAFPSQPPERSCATRGEAVRGAPGAINWREKQISERKRRSNQLIAFLLIIIFYFSSGVSFSAQRGSRHASTPLLLSRHMGPSTSPHRLAPFQFVSGCAPPIPLHPLPPPPSFLSAAVSNKKENLATLRKHPPQKKQKTTSCNLMRTLMFVQAKLALFPDRVWRWVRQQT